MNFGLMKQVPGSAGQVILATVLALSLAACGGGGGSAGSTGAGATATTGTGTTGTGTTGTGTTGTGTTTTAAVPTITLSLVNGSTSTTSISASGATSAQATVLDDKGQPVKGKLVTFAADATLVTFSPVSGAVLTDASGVAKIQLAPASLASAGAGAISATSTVAPSTGGTALVTTGSLDFQLSAANLTLSALNVGAATLNAYGNRTVSVQANINGTAATSTPVQINFSASCGTVSPVTVTTNGTGLASSTYTANSTATPGCAGANVTITAAATGATSVNGSVAVNPTQATNIQFVSASPQLIYLSNSTGAKQSQVVFKVVDSSNSPLANQALTVSLVNGAPGIGLGSATNSSPVSATTDITGTASVAVFSGTIPTSVQVKAQLASNAAVNATSNNLIIASGVPVQKAASISLEKFSIEGFNVDGRSSTVTMSLADRQGNPVPVGTTVNFVTSAGLMRPATCTVPALPDGTSASSCAVTIISQGTRPANGRVAILAYTPGEEDFVDANFNNVYDPGEQFTDLGNAYRDDDFSGTYTTGEFSAPQAGSSACTAQISGGAPNDGIPNTCDGVWGSTFVRSQTLIEFATGTAHLNAATTSLSSGVAFIVADNNPNTSPPYANSMPTGTQIAVAGRAHTTAGSCSATVLPNLIDNRFTPRAVSVLPGNSCVAGDFIDITITSPGGIVSPFTLVLTP